MAQASGAVNNDRQSVMLRRPIDPEEREWRK